MGDRKYNHRGYQDDGGSKDRDRSRSSVPYEPRKERLEGAPRGRTAGGFGPDVFKCSLCGVAQPGLGEIVVDSVCECGSDLHACTNCNRFDTSAQWECRATIPERVSPKDKRNECAEFSPKLVADLTADKRSRPSSNDDARKAFDDLFKK